MNPNGKPGNVLSIVLQSSSLAIFACRTVPSNTYSISPCMIRTGCDTEVDVLAEACVGTIVFVADNSCKTVETNSTSEVDVEACVGTAVIAAEDGDGPNVTANLGVEVVVEVCGLTRATEDEDELVRAGTDTDTVVGGCTSPTTDEDEPVVAGANADTIAEDCTDPTEDEDEVAVSSADAKAGTECCTGPNMGKDDAESGGDGCTGTTEDNGEPDGTGTDAGARAEGSTTEDEDEPVGACADSKVGAAVDSSHCSIPAESKQTFEFVQSAKQITFLFKKIMRNKVEYSNDLRY